MASERSQNPDPPQDACFAARLKKQYGEGIDPEVSLGGEGAEAPSGATSELLKRLAEHGVKSPRYKLEGEVARGGMGAILRVWDEDLRRHLAMKVVLGKGDAPGSGATPQLEAKVLARFLEEAQVTGQLDHPGIVPVHELGLDADGRVYFTMKLVKGRDLKAIFDLVFEEKEGWNETRALGVILKACEAMAYAHKKSVIHRDLKPANVMVGSFGEVFVMDWGLARVLGRKDTHDIRLVAEATTAMSSVRTERREEREEAPDSPLVTMDGDVMGTPAYMPPEQARGEVEKLSARSDVYSIGAMLYHLLARQMPYVPPGARVSNRTVLGMVIQGPPTPLASMRKDVPAELVAIVEKAMAREAERRYADTLALAEDLRAYLEHRVVSAHETGTWAETKKWVQRNKHLAASIATAIVLLVVGLTASLVFKAKAERNEERSRFGQALAKQYADDVLSLSAFQDLQDLVESADRLWPASPEHTSDYTDWLSRARELVEGRPADTSRGIKAKPGLAGYELRLANVSNYGRRKILPSRNQDQDLLPSDYFFDSSTEQKWWHSQLTTLVADLKSFTDEETGGLFSSGTSVEHGWGIVRRAEFARTIRERSVDGPEAKRRWDEAIAAIEASPKYGGLELSPQLGLLPIGADPESGLWEFAHLQTGEPPERGIDGKLILKAEMGLVFVLIPGGTYLMGAQSTVPTPSIYPVHKVTLSPYFLSKYEMTQGQWLHFVGRNPSVYGPSYKFDSYQYNLLHPVEQLTWTQCKEVMSRLGLSLPSEEQWECGCRGGTDTAWWTGDDRESLRGQVNIADQTAADAGASWPDIKDWPDLEDEWINHAPVGSFPANPFGLHEVCGNVGEWCLNRLDGFGENGNPNEDPDSATDPAPARVSRGGSFAHAASYAQSAYRDFSAPEHQEFILGLRPARAVQLPTSPVHPGGK